MERIKSNCRAGVTCQALRKPKDQTAQNFEAELRAESCQLRRSARKPNSGSSKRSPCQAFSDRTIQRKNIASEPRIASNNRATAAAILETSTPTIAAIKNELQRKMLCHA